MALTHLLDSSVLTRLRDAAIRGVVEPAAERGELARAGIGDLEIGHRAAVRVGRVCRLGRLTPKAAGSVD